MSKRCRVTARVEKQDGFAIRRGKRGRISNPSYGSAPRMVHPSLCPCVRKTSIRFWAHRVRVGSLPGSGYLALRSGLSQPVIPSCRLKIPSNHRSESCFSGIASCVFTEARRYREICRGRNPDPDASCFGRAADVAGRPGSGRRCSIAGQRDPHRRVFSRAWKSPPIGGGATTPWSTSRPSTSPIEIGR